MNFRHLIGCALLALAPSVLAGEVVADSLASATLQREVRFTVYLPDGYRSAAGPYPAVYLLHGASGDENQWRTKGGLAETMDALIGRGAIRPMVVVMPSFGKDSWFIDGAVDRAESALMNDLLAFVEGKYKVAKERKGRAIGGLSMGGYGALNLSLSHPGAFCAAAIISPAIYVPQPPEISASRRTPQFMKNGQFDPAQWESLSYPARLGGYQQQPRKVPMWIEAGDHDSAGIALSSAQLYWTLFQIQPKQVELRIVDGGHEWLVFREALPAALQYIDRQCQEPG